MLRRARFPRKYHGSTGKGTLPMDEALELANRFYAQFPKVCTLKAFAKQGNYIGLAIMCKRMVLEINSFSSYSSKNVYRSGSTPRRVAERTMVYEIFTHLKASVECPLRQFKRDFVSSCVKLVKTKLIDKKLEAQIKDYTNDQAFQFLSSVGQILDEMSNPKEDDDEDNDDDDEIETDESAIARDIRDETLRSSGTVDDSTARHIDQQLQDDTNRTIEAILDEPDLSDDQVSAKLGYSRFMISSPWEHGERLLAKDDVKGTRMAAFARKERKRRINRAIVDSMDNDDTANGSTPAFECNVERDIDMPAWTKFVMAKFSRFYN